MADIPPVKPKDVIKSGSYLGDLKGYKGIGKNKMAKLEAVINEAVYGYLTQRKALPEKFNDHHIFHKRFGECRNCHLQPDTILLYRMNQATVELLRLGSHADLKLG